MKQQVEETAGREVGTTKSVCPKCLQVIPARKMLYQDGVYLEKECREHGKFRTLIWEGSLESYEAWGRTMQPADCVPAAKPADRGCPHDCGLCAKHERQGCCVLLEVTDRCNLGCPVCFASAGEKRDGDVPLLELERQMHYLMEHGGPFNIQLSGGEPIVRDDLPDIIRAGRKIGFSFFQLNTNGLRLAEEDGYAQTLKEAGLSCVFLQFDGLKDEVYQILRGRRLLAQKEAAIDACQRAGLGVILVPVIAPGLNEDQVGEILAYAKERMPVVRGVHFQPLSYFGRCLKALGGYRITIPRILSLMEQQTADWVKAEHFTGGNATNPYCTFQANYMLQEDGSMRPLLHAAARTTQTSGQAREFVARQWSGPQEECCCGAEETVQEECCCEKETVQEECCCEAETAQKQGGCCCGEDTAQMQLDTSSLDEFLRRAHNHTFAISGMLFQDAYNLDLARLRRCYILETDSRYGMVPFCAYNLTSEDGKTLYR